MKKCKYCQSDIDEKAKVCPNCRKKQNKFPVWLRIALGLFIVILGISLIANSGGKTQEVNKDTSEYITLDEFNQIENGMSYEDVKNIIGSDGTVVSESQVGNYKMVIYSWYGEDEISNANFNFENDKLINKTQIGLK